MITANLATIKSRRYTLQGVIDSLKHQVDTVRVYANDYTPDVKDAEVMTGEDYTDNSKFYWFQRVRVYTYHAMTILFILLITWRESKKE